VPFLRVMSLVSTGTTVIDKLLGGGLEPGVITTIFGPAGAGKSNLAMLAAVATANKGKKVVFIDTEKSISVERLKQLEPQKYKFLAKNLIVLEPTNFAEQKSHFRQLQDLADAEKPSLIVVDSMVMLYRLQLGSEAPIEVTNREMANQLGTLSEIARKRNIPVLVTNQVYSDIKTSEIKMVGGDLLKYWSKCIIKLERIDGIRRAEIWKHRSIKERAEVFFDISDKGLVEMQKPKKKFSLF